MFIAGHVLLFFAVLALIFVSLYFLSKSVGPIAATLTAAIVFFIYNRPVKNERVQASNMRRKMQATAYKAEEALQLEADTN